VKFFVEMTIINRLQYDFGNTVAIWMASPIGGKMKKTAFILAVLIMFSQSSFAREVNIILKDKSLVNGELIGISNGIIYLKAKDDKSDQIHSDTVSEIFDRVTGEKIMIDLEGSASLPKESETKVQSPIAEAAKQVKPILFIFGTMDSGLIAFLPCQPLEDTYIPGSAYIIGPQSYDLAWGAGAGIEYRFMDSLAGGIDFGLSSWEKLLAKKDGYGVGEWVWEQSDYTDARVGPFPMDVKYYMDTIFMRVGAKYYPMDGIVQPFIGASLGIYTWDAVIGNRGEEKKYSEISSGISSSISYQFGIDFVFDEFALRIFADMATAVGNPEFENLFVNGWTFENTGGEHVQGPTRFGIALGMSI
jgi:hypothetical protein